MLRNEGMEFVPELLTLSRTWSRQFLLERLHKSLASLGVVTRQVLHQLDSLSRTQYVTAYAVALVHAALGQRDSAFVWLNKAVEERTHWLRLNRDRRWDPIRSDPRFAAIARRVGLPD